MKIHFPKRQRRVLISSLPTGSTFSIGDKDVFMKIQDALALALGPDPENSQAVNLSTGELVYIAPTQLVRPFDCELLLKTSRED